MVDTKHENVIHTCTKHVPPAVWIISPTFHSVPDFLMRSFESTGRCGMCPIHSHTWNGNSSDSPLSTQFA